MNYLDKFVTYSNNLNTDSKSIDIEITGNNTINNQNINEIKDNQHKKGNNNEIIFSSDSKYDKDIYELYLNYYNEKAHKIYIKIKNENKFEIPKFPILIGDNIRPFFYIDYFIYLYYDKKNILDISRYPKYINKIKSEQAKKDKKKYFRKMAKQYFLDNNNNLYKKVKKKLILIMI